MGSDKARADRIAQYLAGKLGDEERASFEAQSADDPAMLDQLQTEFSLKAGLEDLDARGELAALMRSKPPFWNRTAFALAASLVACVALGVAVYSTLRWRDQALFTAQLQEDLSAARGPRALSAVQAITLLRGATQVELPWDGWIGLSIDADGLEGRDVAFEVTRVDGSLVWKGVHHVSADGTVMLVLDSGTVPPGDYRLTLKAPGMPAKEYQIETTGGAP